MLNIEDVPFAAAAAGFGVAAGFGAAGPFLLNNEKNPFEAGAAGFGAAGFGAAGAFLLKNEKNPFEEEAGAAGFGAAGFAAAGSFFLNNEENPFETAAFAEVSLELIAEPALPAAAFAEVSPELIAEPALPSIVFPDAFDEFLRVLEVAFFENLFDTLTAVLTCFFTAGLGRLPIAFIASSGVEPYTRIPASFIKYGLACSAILPLRRAGSMRTITPFGNLELSGTISAIL
jgi:hypothetical protein